MDLQVTSCVIAFNCLALWVAVVLKLGPCTKWQDIFAVFLAHISPATNFCLKTGRNIRSACIPFVRTSPGNRHIRMCTQTGRKHLQLKVISEYLCLFQQWIRDANCISL